MKRYLIILALLTYKGETLCVAEWAERKGLKIPTLWMRLFKFGWVERALNASVARNKRTNRFLTYKGETLCITEWAERKGLKNSTLWRRLFKHRWDVERALNTPVRHR
jgi:hypothetical protein